jgi:hypothetical protein
VSSISAVTEHDGKLSLSNLGGSFVSVFDFFSIDGNQGAFHSWFGATAIRAARDAIDLISVSI